jgi:hypothetical protein
MAVPTPSDLSEALPEPLSLRGLSVHQHNKLHLERFLECSVILRSVVQSRGAERGSALPGVSCRSGDPRRDHPVHDHEGAWRRRGVLDRRTG